MTKEKVKFTKKGVKVYADGGYNHNVELLAHVRDTGNGFIARFPSYCSTAQDNYVCLDYSDAEHLRTALNALHKKDNGFDL
jgi:hypothetical protein